MKFFTPVLIAAFFSLSANAQQLEITAYGSSSAVFGDFADTDISNSSAAYSPFSSTAGLGLNYYFKNNFGLGLRASGTFYRIDQDAYHDNIVEALQIQGDNYDVTNSLAYGFAAINTELGVSYLFDVAEKLQLEPYVFFGAVAMASPATSVVYQENGETYTFKIKEGKYQGISYAPGLRLKWNVCEHFGLNVFAEYQGSVFSEEDQTSIKQSATSLDITNTSREFTINSVALGLGLTYRCGLGRNKE